MGSLNWFALHPTSLTSFLERTSGGVCNGRWSMKLIATVLPRHTICIFIQQKQNKILVPLENGWRIAVNFGSFRWLSPDLRGQQRPSVDAVGTTRPLQVFSRLCSLLFWAADEWPHLGAARWTWSLKSQLLEVCWSLLKLCLNSWDHSWTLSFRGQFCSERLDILKNHCVGAEKSGALRSLHCWICAGRLRWSLACHLWPADLQNVWAFRCYNENEPRISRPTRWVHGAKTPENPARISGLWLGWKSTLLRISKPSRCQVCWDNGQPKNELCLGQGPGRDAWISQLVASVTFKSIKRPDLKSEEQERDKPQHLVILVVSQRVVSIYCLSYVMWCYVMLYYILYVILTFSPTSDWLSDFWTAEDKYESMKIIGDRQATAAKTIFERATEPLGGPPFVFWRAGHYHPVSVYFCAFLVYVFG